MLEPKRPDARTNLMRHVHQLEIRLLIPAHFGALNQHAQECKIDPIPGLAIHHEFATSTRQRCNNLRPELPAVLAIELSR